MSFFRQMWRLGRSGFGRRIPYLAWRLERLEDRLTPSNSSGTVLVADINPGSAGSDLRSLTDVNGTLFFNAYDGVHGYELWKSDSAGTAMVKDINPGADGSFPRRMANFNGTLFFVADDGATGYELWKSDGTAGGTLFFVAEDGATGYELWKSDGTTAGTVLVKDINPGTGDSFPDSLTNVNGTLFFSADDGTHGRELWKSDGTNGGTVLVGDLRIAGQYMPGIMANVNGTLFLSASNATQGAGLWKTDGTAAGTVLVKSVGANNLTNVNGTLYFAGDDGINGTELWKSDGTTAGTVLVKDIYTGSTTSNYTYNHNHQHAKYPNSSSPSNLTNLNGTLYFAAINAKYGAELWKSNGTSAGTVLVKDICGGRSSSNPAHLTVMNGTLYFSANDATHGNELWKSNGTSTGTVLVKDINATANPYIAGDTRGSYPGGQGAYSSNFISASGTLYFTADDGIHGMELWKSDGTASGTALVADINPGSAASIPTSLTLSGTHLFFSADDGVHGTELWDPPVSISPSAASVLAIPPASLPTPAAGLNPTIDLRPTPSTESRMLVANLGPQPPVATTFAILEFEGSGDLFLGSADLALPATARQTKPLFDLWTWIDPALDSKLSADLVGPGK